MRSISDLFGSSPFVKLVEHFELVEESVKLLPELIKAMIDSDKEKIHQFRKEISKLENSADG